MAHLDGFDALTARPIDGKICPVLVPLLELQAAEGAMLPWHFNVEVKVDAQQTNA